jgi:predicted RNA-binding Zn-ribbon protein involved in translation (DUF1610 family)
MEEKAQNTADDTCISCKKNTTNITGSVRFPCPGCGMAEIVRCGRCRSIAAKYTCPECKFSGPN